MNRTPARTRIKICGIREADHARAASNAGADAVGLNFVERSPRYVDEATAAAVAAALPVCVEPIGLFADADVAHVRAIAQRIGLRTIQLHGAESMEEAAALAPLRIIKAIAFTSPAATVEQVAAWSRVPNVSALLFDAPAATSPGPAGGTGKALHWDAVAAALAPTDSAGTAPVMLAGGLTHENVGEAVRTARPWAVDVASGVEATRGVKDPDLIAAFCRAVRAADAQCRRGDDGG